MRDITSLRLTVAMILLFVSAMAGAAHAQTTIRVRLLEADNSAMPSTPELQDVLPLLRENLRFQSYRLLASRDAAATAGTRVALAHDLNLTVTESNTERQSVQVHHLDRLLLETKLRLTPGKPIILGGFPSRDGGSLIIVITSL